MEGIKISKELVRSVVVGVLTEYYYNKPGKQGGLTEQDRTMFNRIFNSPINGDAHYQYHKYGKVRND